MASMEWVRGEAIGRGSFGTVNLAIPRSRSSSQLTPPLMAVKSSEVSDSASLENERQVLSQLGDCPHIIRCFGDDFSYENGKRLYNVFLEYASGGSLADRIKNSVDGHLTESDVRRHTRSILEGLCYIHGNGFVHCDIKLQNILLCSSPANKNDVVKIADFGLAKQTNVEDRGFELRGTPLYMSPEVVTGKEVESPADIWALGCTVVEMVTGKPAWRCKPESDVSALLLRIGVGDEVPEIPGELSEEGKDFLGKCFVKDPRMRWTAEMLLDHPFVIGDYTVASKVTHQPSTSPRDPFDFPDWVTVQSSMTSSIPSLVSPESDTWVESSANRIRQLVTDHKLNWSLSDSWTTVRQSE